MSATAHLGLTFRKESKLGDVQLEYDLQTYVDADYAHTAEDRRSVSGVAVCCRGTLVSWFSRTQKCETLSTTEAEYVSMADGVKEAPYVRGVLVFLMPSLGSPSIGVFGDNKGAIDLAENPLSSSNSKHIDVRYHFLRELVGKEDLCVKYLRTEDQHADILTKAIARESFEKHRGFLLGIKVFRRKLLLGVASVVAGLLVDPAPGRVFDIACLNEQSRNNDGHGGSSDVVLSDYPTVYCGKL